MDGQQVLEQSAPKEEDQPQKIPTHSGTSYGSSAQFTVHNEDSVNILCPNPISHAKNKESLGSYSSADPILSVSLSLNLVPSPSKSQMVPISIPSPQTLENPPKELTSLQDSVSSLDLKVEHIKDDTDFTMQSTVQLRWQLETLVDGLDIKIVVLESTLVRQFADNQQNLAALETGLVRHFADSQQYFVDEVTSLKPQVAEMVDCLKELCDGKKGEGPSSKKGEGTAAVKREDGFDQRI
ncbi:hypothetical protein F511_25882 [Dorcoceras hygrometricum]|uniref:Uncharacterized protein n=1 Tax=Dorcoceras hygrometricum TaxID=472368 RepID=A0A2Z7A5K8_9LAMI|nr:hypothetical protein F511_25882 [Dorcoceras hygrometricum]